MSIGAEVAFSPHGTAAADVIGYAGALPFASGSFDTILCTKVLEYTRQIFLLLEAKDVLSVTKDSDHP